jgi:hypothetical protein
MSEAAHVLAVRGQPDCTRVAVGSRRSILEVSAAMGAKVLERFPAGAPRGSWPAEEYAAARRAEGEPATVVMDLKSDAFLVVVPAHDED